MTWSVQKYCSLTAATTTTMAASSAYTRTNRFVGQLTQNPTAGESTFGPISVAFEDAVAIITINNPPVNSFSESVTNGLKAALASIHANSAVKAIVLTGTGKFFMAGADITKIQKDGVAAAKLVAKGIDPAVSSGLGNTLRIVTELLYQFESGPIPTVCAVNGVAFGGGLELAMGCNARVGCKGSAYGLPELKLGLIPGFGGTQRLPRLIGLVPAMQATLKSKTFNDKAALKAGIIDALVDAKDLLPTAIKLANSLAAGQVPRRMALHETSKIGGVEAGVLAIAQARLGMSKQKKSSPQAFALLDAIQTGLEKGGPVGLAHEAVLIQRCAADAVSRALIHFFFAQRESSKIPDAVAKHPFKIKTVAVLGGGTMGASICIVYLTKGYNVILKEINEQLAAEAVVRVAKMVAAVLKKMKMPALAAEGIMRNLRHTATYDGFEKVDLVVEAVLENIKIKQDIFTQLEKVCHPKTILASNTSTIDLDVIGANTTCRDRIIGLHFFAPAHVMPLLEIIRTNSTSAACVTACLEMSKRIGKTPAVVGNCVGFTANRIFFPYGQSACMLLERGISPYVIDKALLSMGMPMGVFQMSDLSGLDIFKHVNVIMNSAYGARCYNSTLINSLVDAGRLGQKKALGFYDYSKNKRGSPDEKGLAPFLAKARADAGNPAPFPELSQQDICEMVLFPVVNESLRVVEEKFVLRSSDVDVCSVMGYGFPAHLGGILFWGENYAKGGFKYVHARMKYFAETHGSSNPAIKAFFQPCALLTAKASE